MAPPAGLSTSAVIVSERFLMLMNTFSDIPFMPACSVSDVRSPIRSGRPASFALTRSTTRSSMGSTRYFTASFMNRSCISFSFAGFWAARSLTRLKSLRVS